jgi:hypothetical protein
MDQVSSSDAFRNTSVTLLAALLVLLLMVPAAVADSGGTASYQYKVTGFSYDATGQLGAGKLTGGCVGNAFWEGTVTTTESDLSELSFGGASLEIGKHGSSGSINAHVLTTSTLGPAYHRITTACDEEGINETAFRKTDCNTGTASNPMRARVDIEGGVGNQVSLFWNFFIPGGGGFLVSNVFSCVEPLKFPGRSPGKDYCQTRAGLSKFTATTVNLPFNCFYDTVTPPIGSRYSSYTSTASAKGLIRLKRTKQS